MLDDVPEQLHLAVRACRSALDEIQEVLFLTDARGRFTFLTPSWTDLFGHDVHSTLGARCAGYLLPEDQARYRTLVRSLVRHPHERHCYAIRGIASDGSVRRVEGRVRLMRDGQGAIVGACGTLQDCTERHQERQRMQLAASVFEGAQECIVITDAHSHIVEVNEAFIAHTGYAREQVIGRRPTLLASGRHDKRFYRQMWASLRQAGQWSGEIWNRRADGELVAERVRIRTVLSPEGQPTHYVAFYNDVTRLKRQQEDLARLAHFDALTGLPNRVLALDRLGQLIALAERQGQRVAVCQLDLDDFKTVNDTLGHGASDGLLLQVARRLSQALRASDTVARVGGDEFVLLLANVGSTAALEPLLQRVQQTLAQPYALDGQPPRMTASLGLALYPQHGDTPEHLLRAADQAMYRAKRLGKNRICMADDDTAHGVSPEAALLDELRQALARGQLCLHYQPKVCARTGTVLGAEALVRWQHPQRGLLPPGAFLPIVVGTPLEVQLDLWVICAAVAQWARWRSQGRALHMSINVSPGTLVLPELANTVAAIVRSAEQAAGGVQGGIELEVLETAALDDLDAAGRAIEACARQGISFALDDFGTGYSSLRYLRKLPVRTLKIDRSFVSNMLSDQGDLHIVRAVIGLAQAFGVRTVAEGVETAEHARKLAELGCEQLQGYGIARPMPAQALEAWLDRQPQEPQDPVQGA